jgi:hypothetical protein
VLVGAVFDAFTAIYRRRVQDLLRIYTGGSGVLPAGAIHPDLVRRLADEAATSATHVLTICIRALDYLPPVDVTFFEYLRALITADIDIVPDDRHNYRVAFIEAFRRRGIYPVDVGTPTPGTVLALSVDTVRWQGHDLAKLPPRAVGALEKIIARLQRYADECLYLADRGALFKRAHDERKALHGEIKAAFAASPRLAVEFGLDPKRTFEVHQLRPAMRVSPNGRHVPQVVVALTQSTRIEEEAGVPKHTFRGGSTLIVDLSVPEVKYSIIKGIGSERRRARTADFIRALDDDPLRGLFFAPDRKEPFAALHSLADDGL